MQFDPNGREYLAADAGVCYDSHAGVYFDDRISIIDVFVKLKNKYSSDKYYIGADERVTIKGKDCKCYNFDIGRKYDVKYFMGYDTWHEEVNHVNSEQYDDNFDYVGCNEDEVVYYLDGVVARWHKSASIGWVLVKS